MMFYFFFLFEGRNTENLEKEREKGRREETKKVGRGVGKDKERLNKEEGI